MLSSGGGVGGIVSTLVGISSGSASSSHQPLPRLKHPRSKLDAAAGRLFSSPSVGATIHPATAAELECGNMSSSSSSSSDVGAGVGGGSSDEANEDDGDAENDVDDETMSGDNDVNEYTVTMSQPASVLLSDLESLTGSTEPESLTMTTMSNSTSAAAAARASSLMSVTSSSSSRMTSIEDEMLLLRLIDMQSGAEGANAAPGVASSARMANM